MKNSVLETDGQTDREKSALVELRFAAKKEQKSSLKFIVVLSVSSYDSSADIRKE